MNESELYDVAHPGHHIMLSELENKNKKNVHLCVRVSVREGLPSPVSTAVLYAFAPLQVIL